MDLRLVEDTSVKQFSFDNDRQNIASDKVVTELRAVSKDNKFIFQLHPKNFKELQEILADIISNSTGLGNELDISHHGGETECNFCGEKRNGYIDVPVALNIGTENELYPSVASSEVKIEMCESCIDELIEELERITEERKDIILAHQI
jgi:hypothetical protein